MLVDQNHAPVEVWDQYCTKPKRVLAPRKHRPRHFQVRAESWYVHDHPHGGEHTLVIDFIRGKLCAPTYTPMKRLVGKPGTTLAIEQWASPRAQTKPAPSLTIGPFTVMFVRSLSPHVRPSVALSSFQS